MAQMNNALPALNAKEDKHNVFNDGKERTIRYVEWKDEMKTKARSCAKPAALAGSNGSTQSRARPTPSRGRGFHAARWLGSDQHFSIRIE